MKRKDVNYRYAKELIYTKDKALSNYIDSMLIKCQQMFYYENLPDTVPKYIFEQMLMENGYCIFTKENDKYYIFQGGLGGELDEYYRPTKCIVSNPALKLNKEYTINEDCILVMNDSKQLGLMPLLSKYGVLCGDCEISLNMITNILRSQYIFSATDNKTKENAELYIKKLVNGDFSVIGENQFLDGVKVHNVTTNSNYIQQFIELNQYLKATAYNEIGLDANFNMKRERLTESEVELNTSVLIPMADDMLECRKKAVEMINKKFGLNIMVDLSSVWKMQKETVDQATDQVDTTAPNEINDTEPVEPEPVEPEPVEPEPVEPEPVDDRKGVDNE